MTKRETQEGTTVGRGANQRVKGTPEQERARGERNARMQMHRRGTRWGAGFNTKTKPTR